MAVWPFYVFSPLWGAVGGGGEPALMPWNAAKTCKKEITLTVSKTTHKHNLNHNIVATELKSQLLSILSHIATTSLLLSEPPNYIYVYKPFSMY